MSVGFYASANDDVWRRGEPSGDPLMVIRRGVEVKEVSLVQWPAYDAALVSGIHERTRDGERRHPESDRVIAEALRSVAETKKLLERRR